MKAHVKQKQPGDNRHTEVGNIRNNAARGVVAYGIVQKHVCTITHNNAVRGVNRNKEAAYRSAGRSIQAAVLDSRQDAVSLGQVRLTLQAEDLADALGDPRGPLQPSTGI